MKEYQNISGVYSIVNIMTGKKYIGSSKDIFVRLKRHFSNLKRNKHTNSHLQSSFNKYGFDKFTFKVLMVDVQEKDLISYEQKFINQSDPKLLYNQTLIAGSGGGDSTRKPLLLLNLKGDIIQEFESGVALAKFLNTRLIVYKNINTSSITKKTYRIVTPEFYSKNLKEIKSWKAFSNYSEYKVEKNLEDKYEVINKDQKICFSSQKDLTAYLGITHQRVSQIINFLKNQQVKSYYHKKTCNYIQLIKKND